MVYVLATEKGYAIVDPKGAVLPGIAADFEKGPEKPEYSLSFALSKIRDSITLPTTVFSTVLSAFRVARMAWLW